MEKRSLFERDACLSFVIPPLLAVGVLTRALVAFVVPDLLPLWIAIPLCLLLSILWVAYCIASSGADQVDFIVMSFFCILMGLMLFPVGLRAAEKRRHHRQAQSQTAALRTKPPTTSPQTVPSPPTKPVLRAVPMPRP